MNEKELIKIERIHVFDGNGPIKAFCDIVLLDTFLVKGLRIIHGPKELFVSMPQQQGRDGKWHEIFFPTSKEIRKKLQGVILEAFSTQTSQ